MPFREKSAWISLLLYLGIYGFYFTQVATALTRGEADGTHFLALFGQSVVMFVIATIVLTVVAAVWAPKDAQAPKDERKAHHAESQQRIGICACRRRGAGDRRSVLWRG